MKGLIAAIREAEAAGVPIRIVHWREAEAMRVDEAAWAEAWSRVHQHQVRPVIAWQPWPGELARDWLGLGRPPLLPQNVRSLLEEARPLLTNNNRRGGRSSARA
ncbi:hypothetical protein [Streptomyces niveus]|uniref:hypothetical protein n=1 Tax=Streptomyces niveus TaxID=193462 RepID=UPI00344A0170